MEDYGVFVELSPNLSGLAEKKEGLRPGDPVSVYIKSMIPDKMKVKLVIIDRLPKGRKAFIKEEDYFIRSGNIKEWIYSPGLLARQGNRKPLWRSLNLYRLESLYGRLYVCGAKDSRTGYQYIGARRDNVMGV